MKYVVLILLLGLSACKERAPEFRPDMSKGYEMECDSLLETHWIKTQAAWDLCVTHVAKPKHKIGTFLKMKNSEYAKNCKFRVGAPTINAVQNKKAYWGTVLCKDIDGKYQSVSSFDQQHEEDLR